LRYTIQKIIQSGPGYWTTPPFPPQSFPPMNSRFYTCVMQEFFFNTTGAKKNKQRFRYFYRHIKNSSVQNLLKLFKKMLQYLFKYGFIFGPIKDSLESYACQKTCVLGSWNHVTCSDGSSPTRCFGSVRLVSIGYFF
jgi:hypothetical protein